MHQLNLVQGAMIRSVTPASAHEASNSLLGTSREGTSSEVTHLPLEAQFDVHLTDQPGCGILQAGGHRASEVPRRTPK